MDVNEKKIYDRGDVQVFLVTEKDERPKCFYYRPCGMQVGPWPCDPRSQKHYLSRGFLLEPPEVKPLTPKYSCTVCKKEYESIAEVIDCLKSHEEEEKHGFSRN
jgi:hypothetical protein